MTKNAARAAVCALALALLWGCASPQELRRADAGACRSYGFVPGTPPFAGCLQRQDLSRTDGGFYPSAGLGVGTGFGETFGGAGIDFGF
ncbi:MAG: hypothetical protein ACREFQ_02650 [Stellaceae bacterium]